MKRWQQVTVGAAVVAVGLSGCAGDSEPVEAAETTEARIEASPEVEQALRDLYTEFVAAMGSYDTDGMLALTCRELQEPIRAAQFDDPIFGLGFFGPPEVMQRMTVEEVQMQLQPTLAPASEASVKAVAQALVAGDPEAYRVAVQQVRKETNSAEITHFDSIVAEEDTATVQATFTITAFTQPSEEIKGTNHAVLEDGKWKDCTSVRDVG